MPARRTATASAIHDYKGGIKQVKGQKNNTTKQGIKTSCYIDTSPHMTLGHVTHFVYIARLPPPSSSMNHIILHPTAFSCNTSAIRVPRCVFKLCLRRKRVEGRVYIHEWQSRVELRDDYGTHFPTTVGVRRNVVLTIIDGDISDARGHRV